MKLTIPSSRDSRFHRIIPSLVAVIYTIPPFPLQLTVKVLANDLQDGLVLIAMLETLAAPKKVGPYNKNPKIKPQLIENLNAAFKFLAKENVKVVNISESFLALLFSCLHLCYYSMQCIAQGVM